MSKKVLITISTIVIIFIIGTVAYLSIPTTGNSVDAGAQKSDKQNTATKGVETSNKEKKESKPAPEEEAKHVGSVDEKKVENIEGFSSSDIKEATEFITQYSYASHGNKYFLGGEWAKNGAKISELTSFMNAFYSKEIIDDISKLEGKQGSEEFAEKVTTLVPFFDDTKYYSPSESCSKDTGIKLDEKGNPLETNEVVEGNSIDCLSNMDISEISFTSNKEDQGYFLRAEFRVKADLALYSKELNSEAKTSTDYKYVLRMEKLILDENKSQWEITGYTISPSMSQIKEIDSTSGEVNNE